MSLRWFYQNAANGISEMVGKVQFTGSARQGTDGLVVNAEEGTVGRSKINFDDSTGTFEIAGHRKVYAVVDEAQDDDFAGVIWVGYTASREISEGHPFDGNGRVWEIELDDLNTVLDRRVMEGNDSNRAVESDVERVQWLFATNEAAPILDDTYLSTDAPVQMDKADYRGQKFSQVLDDCAQQSGKNWYVIQLSNGNPIDGDPTLYALWYGHGTLEEYVSDIRISNLATEIDGVITFAPAARDTKLKRDPTRVFSGVHMNYDGGHVYVQRTTTVEDFDRRDTVAQAENVKTAARARSRANRMLRDLDTEEDRIFTSIVVPAVQVNAVRWGHYIQVQLSWAPGYANYVWLRVANRTVRPLAPGVYEIALELVGPSRASGAGTAATGVLYMTQGSGGLVHFAAPGDTPPSGWLPVPTNAFLTPVVDGSPPNDGWPYLGWDVTGTGTLDLRLYLSTIGVLIDNIGYNIEWGITLNGAIVGSHSESASGFLEIYSSDGTVTVSGLAVAPGDQIRVYLVCAPPTMPFFRTPAGTGQNGEGLYVTGGSLS